MVKHRQISKFCKIGEAAKLLGVSTKTLRRWEAQGRLCPTKRSPGNTRYYSIADLLDQQELSNDLTIGYARVSSHDQKKDLQTQATLLSSYCTAQGWQHEVIQDPRIRHELPARKGLSNRITNSLQ